MASTYSPSLKLELIGNGDQSGTWGTTTNNNLGTLLEQAITGVQNITMSNADYTLTNYNGVTDEARNAVLVVSGTNSAVRQIIIPANQEKLYVIRNATSGGYAITIGAITGATISIPNGVTAQVYYDGTDCFSSQTGSAGNFTVNGTLTATGLTDTGNMSVGGTLGVTGATSLTTGSISGIMTAPTAAAGTNTTQIATTAFVQTATGTLGTMATQNANAVAITGGTINGVTGTSSGLTAGSATNLLTGGTIASDVTATTQATNDNSTKVATTAYVQNQINNTPQIKAWANFDGTASGTISPRASSNVASIVKNATGDYTITFTTALTDANYVVSGSAASNGGGSSYANCVVVLASGTAQTASAFRIFTGYTGSNASSGGNADSSYVQFMVVR
jgi:hypothetical protein